eukprot:2496134-Pyramimonas_sp.AAC.1
MYGAPGSARPSERENGHRPSCRQVSVFTSGQAAIRFRNIVAQHFVNAFTLSISRCVWPTWFVKLTPTWPPLHTFH